MNLKLPTFANYYYIFTCYWADSATSDDGATDEGSSCSLPEDAASGSAKIGATFTSNPTSRSGFAKGSVSPPPRSLFLSLRNRRSIEALSVKKEERARNLHQKRPPDLPESIESPRRGTRRQVRSKGTPHAGHADSISNDEHGSRSDIYD